MNRQPIYLDCAASTPMEPEVIDFITHHFKNTWGNPHSRTHEYGSKASRLIETARVQVAEVVDAKPQEVIFTSGATEANNIVIQSMIKRVEYGEKVHVLASCIEHPSVLEPLKFVQQKGVEVELLNVLKSGRIDLEDFQKKLRPTTALVSVMQVNSETGIKQPIAEVCEVLSSHMAIFHVDAAQGFGKDLEPMNNKRIDFISCSSHKIFGPKGVGALIARAGPRTQNFLVPIVFGGGQEVGIRSGTVAAPIIGGFGKASQLALTAHAERKRICEGFGRRLFEALKPVAHMVIGDERFRIYSTANITFPSVDSEAFLILSKTLLSVSNGTACASDKHQVSPVLSAMGMDAATAETAVRFSWSHLTNYDQIEWDRLRTLINLGN